MDLNKVMIIGNATRDAELKSTSTGLHVASFSVATNLVWTDQSGQKQQRAESDSYKGGFTIRYADVNVRS